MHRLTAGPTACGVNPKFLMMSVVVSVWVRNDPISHLPPFMARQAIHLVLVRSVQSSRKPLVIQPANCARPSTTVPTASGCRMMQKSSEIWDLQSIVGEA